jgi:hypothetical protein
MSIFVMVNAYRNSTGWEKSQRIALEGTVTKLYVPLRPDEIDRLQQMAESERRRPAEQASYLLSLALAEKSEEKRPAGAASQ